MHYQVQVSKNSSFTDLVINTLVKEVTEYSLTKELEPFTIYYWRVKSIDDLTGAQSAWSEPCMFRVKATDVIINQTVVSSFVYHSSLVHKFIRSYDYECELPNAKIGMCMSPAGDAQIGLCLPDGMDAQIGACLPDGMDAKIGVGYCPGVCVPQFDGFELEFIFTESNDILFTEDGYMLALEF